MENKNGIYHVQWAVTWCLAFSIILVTYHLTRKQIDSKFDSLNSRMDQFMYEWKCESKDFHGRLCAIEERNRRR